ncbi:hypothetical protein MNBD_GAMMA18-70 [hydrothermal vent metagenome]|uniref:Uncharacterized protein n=1 Tax=hydrothermal vent metagenome TaxID=652676 RepID=A0A3B1A0Y3_9ZZZZ
MTYMINAQFEQGMPSLVLVDAATGEERLHWRGDKTVNGEGDWKGLFKRLMLLSCANQLGLPQRAKLPTFGNECIECDVCIDQAASMEAKNIDADTAIISLLRLKK